MLFLGTLWCVRSMVRMRATRVRVCVCCGFFILMFPCMFPCVFVRPPPPPLCVRSVSYIATPSPCVLHSLTGNTSVLLAEKWVSHPLCVCPTTTSPTVCTVVVCVYVRACVQTHEHFLSPPLPLHFRLSKQLLWCVKAFAAVCLAK